MTASIHRLSAGDGYTYLTKQVAAADVTTLGRSGLADYYSEKGEQPGKWAGSGLSGLFAVEEGQQVTEAQMKALFGEGLQPNADILEAQVIAEHPQWGKKRVRQALQLGNGFREYGPAPLVVATAQAFREWNASQGLAETAPIDPQKREEIRTRVALGMFVDQHKREPLSVQELTGFVARESRKQRSAVAGFDMTFSPVKSVSALWAVADRATAEQISAAHDAAVTSALAWMEREAILTRKGTNGVRQVDTQGMIAARFTHRDTRSGDPDLHTHVAIANKVQDMDGNWLSLDGRMMFRTTVAASERYNAALEAELNRRLGLTFAPRSDERAQRKQAVREIQGMDERLLEEWSSRAQMIDKRTAELAEEFKQQHGRIPAPGEMIRLRQQANLDTREVKHEPRSEADQRTEWRRQAEEILSGQGGIDAMLHEVASHTRIHDKQLSDVEAEQLGREAMRTVQHKRSEFRDVHLRGEIERRVRSASVASDVQEHTVSRVLTLALGGDESVQIKAKDRAVEPAPLRRLNGESQYHVAHSTIYTTRTQLAQEAAIVAAAQRTDGRTVSEIEVGTALLESLANGRELNKGQAELVRNMATSGRRVQLALAPAGSGKTTALSALRMAWEASGGTVIGLAPSAAAAEELGASIDVETDTLAQLVFRLENNYALPTWAKNIDDKTLVIVDEAGMAATSDLHTAIEFVTSRGGSVRLIGDDQQLSSVTSGGVLRDIKESVGALSLSELMRFKDEAEALATLRLREGDVEAVGFYADRDRLHVAATQGVLDVTFAAWKSDVDKGLHSVMLAYKRDDVVALNSMAREAQGHVDGPEVTLHNGLHAGVGDLIITTHNDRSLRTTGTDWVANGNKWWVAAVGEDGELVARSTTSGALVTLPRDYVAENVDLGYATTIHASQGSTVDTAHVVIDGSETRQLLYVAMTRGRVENHAYIDAGVDGDEHNIIRPEYVEPRSPMELLEEIVRRDGSQVSATTQRRIMDSPVTLLGREAPRYDDARGALATALLTPERRAEITRRANEIVAGFWEATHDEKTPAPILSNDPAWSSLLGTLALIELQEGDCLPVFAAAVQSRELDTAEMLGAVLDWRLTHNHTPSNGPVPWLDGLPQVLAQHPEYGEYMRTIFQQTRDTAHQVHELYRTMDADRLPEWARLIEGDRNLVGDLAVWRAAQSIPDTEVLPAGPRVPVLRLRTYQEKLEQRVEQAEHIAAKPDPRWLAVLADHDLERVTNDPYWPIVSRRLTQAARTGADVTQILTDALTEERAMPADHPAAALWFRVAPQVQPIIEAARNDLPSWHVTLREDLAPRGYRRLVDTTQWPDIVAGVDQTAQREHLSEEEVVRRAVALLHPETIGTERGITYDQLPAAMLAQLSDLSRPVAATNEPQDPEKLPVDDLDLETQPTAADLAALHQVGGHRHGIQEEGRQHTTGDPAGSERANSTSTQTDSPDLAPAPSPDHRSPNMTPDNWHLVAPADPEELLPPDPLNDVAEDMPLHAAGPQRIIELNQLAASYWREQYQPDSPAAQYIRGRLGTDLRDMNNLVIGYAPNQPNALAQWMTTNGHATPDELVDAGLAKYRARGQLNDTFRDRVVFGIHDDTGALVGFQGRANPGDLQVPKYLNTGATEAFTKGAVLFGLHEASAAIDQGAIIARAEGPLDALAITLAGDGKTVGVAPLGTALTDAQADLIAQHAPSPTVLEATDTDAAGLAAAEKDYWKLTARGLTPHHLVLLDAHDTQRTIKDPAEALQADPHTFALSLAMPDMSPTLATTLVAQRIHQDKTHLDMGSVPAIVAAARDSAHIIAALPPEHWESHVRAAADQLPTPDALPLLAHELLTITQRDEPTPPPAAAEAPAKTLAATPTRAERPARLTAQERFAARMATSATDTSATRRAAIERLSAIAADLDQVPTADQPSTPTAPDPHGQPHPDRDLQERQRDQLARE